MKFFFGLWTLGPKLASFGKANKCKKCHNPCMENFSVNYQFLQDFGKLWTQKVIFERLRGPTKRFLEVLWLCPMTNPPPLNERLGDMMIRKQSLWPPHYGRSSNLKVSYLIQCQQQKIQYQKLFLRNKQNLSASLKCRVLWSSGAHISLLLKPSKHFAALHAVLLERH